MTIKQAKQTTRKSLFNNEIEELDSEESFASSVTHDANELDPEKVKKVAEIELHPMIDQLVNERGKVPISELPMWLRKIFERKSENRKSDDSKPANTHKKDTQRLRGTYKYPLDHTDSCKSIPDYLKVADSHPNARRKSVLYRQDPHLSLTPHSVNTVDKIIEKCKGKVPDALLESIRHIPNKSLKLDKLPTKILNALDNQLEIPSSKNVSAKADSQTEDVETVRLTKSSIDESDDNQNESAHIEKRKGYQTARTTGFPNIDFYSALGQLTPKKEMGLGSNTGSEVDPKTAKNTKNKNHLMAIPEFPNSKKRRSSAIQKSDIRNKDIKLNGRTISLPSNLSGNKNYARRFSRGDSIPGFFKESQKLVGEEAQPTGVDNKLTSKEEEKVAPAKKSAKVAQSTKTMPYKMKIRRPKDISGLSDVALINNKANNMNRRNTVSSMLSTRFRPGSVVSTPSNPFAK